MLGVPERLDSQTAVAARLQLPLSFATSCVVKGNVRVLVRTALCFRLFSVTVTHAPFSTASDLVRQRPELLKLARRTIPRTIRSCGFLRSGMLPRSYCTLWAGKVMEPFGPGPAPGVFRL